MIYIKFVFKQIIFNCYNSSRTHVMDWISLCWRTLKCTLFPKYCNLQYRPPMLYIVS